MMKAYDVLRAAPNTLILGSSRVDIGLDAQNSAWPVVDRPVYNLGLSAASPYVSYRYLQHALSRSRVALVVLGLDFEYFLTGPFAYRPKNPDFELRLAVTRDGTRNAVQRWQHIRDLLHATISLDALTDSIATLVASSNDMSSDLISGNRYDAIVRRRSGVLGAHAFAALSNLGGIREFHGHRRNYFAMADVQAILDLCESRSIRVIVFINPVHADRLEMLDLLGDWQAFEEWKRELVALAARYQGKDGGSRIPLWDFSGYDSYSTEPVSVGGQSMHYFWEPSHYTPALGAAIVKRIFGVGDEHFGVLLSPESIEPHITAIREQRRLYRKHHEAEVNRMRSVYDLVAGKPSDTAAAHH
jgi:hypothetical protein